MSDSILTSIKKPLGIAEDDTAFDDDIIMHINTAITDLDQLGIGPTGGFMVEDAEAKWADYIGMNVLLNNVKTYIYIRVRLLFDPPQSSYLAESLSRQAEKLEWRLNVAREEAIWDDPSVPGAPSGPPSDVAEALAEHLEDTTPHPVYDDGPSLDLFYQNAKV